MKAPTIPKKVSMYLFLVPFAMFGFMHFVAGNKMAGMVPSFIPGGVFWVYLVGLALILPLISYILGKETKLALFLLGVMMFVFVFTIYLPGVLAEGADPSAVPMLLKEIMIGSAAFYMSANE